MSSQISAAQQAWKQHGSTALERPQSRVAAQLRVGGVDVVGLSDGEFRMPQDFISDPAAHASLADAGGQVSMPVGAFLFPGDEPVLVDAGLGPLHEPDITGGNLIRQLAAQGYRPDDIAVLALTHLHADHSGWLGDADGRPVFGNARILIREAEWEHFLGGGPGTLIPYVEAALRESLAAGRVELISGEFPVSRHLTAMPAPGHTPGHTVFAIHDGPERALILGDAVHCPLQLTNPDWEALADVDPRQARITREQLSREMDSAGMPGVGCHFPGLAASRVVGGTLV